MGMDIKRDPAILRRKKIRQFILGGVAVVAVVAISVTVSNLEQAAPTVAESTIWPGTVRRGPFVREIRGAGRLVPEDIRWVPARAAGRVERIVLRAGAEVRVGTVILELSNPDLVQQMQSSELEWKVEQAQLDNSRAQMKTTELQLQNAVKNAKSDHSVAESNLNANRELYKQGLVAELQVKQLEASVGRAKNQLDLAEQQLRAFQENEASQLGPAEARLNQAKVRYEQLARQVDDLRVKSDMNGQLQELAAQVEVGANVGLNQNLARVSDPTRLKAEIRISENQTRDLSVGLPAAIDTRISSGGVSGVVKGRVSRIDPAAVNGTVGVDVTLEGDLPAGARPDLSVDGVVELERLVDVLFVESPAFGQEGGTIMLFKIDPQTKLAHRTQVKLGKRSVQFVEILEGLREGDRVILSDMQQYDSFDRVQLR
jgi:HlyD family secretion protein